VLALPTLLLKLLIFAKHKIAMQFYAKQIEAILIADLRFYAKKNLYIAITRALWASAFKKIDPRLRKEMKS
jgi:hypothetical protein